MRRGEYGRQTRRQSKSLLGTDVLLINNSNSKSKENKLNNIWRTYSLKKIEKDEKQRNVLDKESI